MRLHAHALTFPLGLVVLLGCVPLRGGWDRDALAAAGPDVADLAGERLGDLVPVPALVFDVADAQPAPTRVELVACRFEAERPIRVRAGGAGWSPALGERAMAAFTAFVAQEGLRLERVASGPAEIEIEVASGASADGPEGLGDTLVECALDGGEDVTRMSASEEGAGPRRRFARLARAEIRMRRSGPDAAGRVRRASDEAFVGALLHELAHALGFSGHVAAGESLLARDETVLRGFGRRVLRGEPIVDPTLRAFLRLESGTRLGERTIAEGSARFVSALQALDADAARAGRSRRAIVASVGDREAHWRLRYADGSELGLRFPGWAERLRDGRPLFVWPDRAARETLLRAEAATSP